MAEERSGAGKKSFQKKRRKMCKDLKDLRLIQVHVSNKFCD